MTIFKGFVASSKKVNFQVKKSENLKFSFKINMMAKQITRNPKNLFPYEMAL